jgi:hypothetical protein
MSRTCCELVVRTSAVAWAQARRNADTTCSTCMCSPRHHAVGPRPLACGRTSVGRPSLAGAMISDVRPKRERCTHTHAGACALACLPHAPTRPCGAHRTMRVCTARILRGSHGADRADITAHSRERGGSPPAQLSVPFFVSVCGGRGVSSLF